MVSFISDSDLKAAEEHFFNNKNTAVWAWRWKGAVFNAGHGGCHGGSFSILEQPNRKLSYFGSCGAMERGGVLYYQPGQAPAEMVKESEMVDDICQEYLRWILSDISPWASIHKNDLILLKDKNDRIRAFILGPDAVNVPNRSGILNLCIAARMTRDKHYLFERMLHLRDIGLDFFSAFVCSGMFSYNPITNVWAPTSSGWIGSHEPLKNRWGTTDWRDYKNQGWESWTDRRALNIKKFKSGDYTPTTVSTHTEGWGVKLQKDEKDLFSFVENTAKEMKTRFSKVKIVDSQAILEFAKGL